MMPRWLLLTWLLTPPVLAAEMRFWTNTTGQIIEAMRLVYERMKIIIEPSCAVPLAALLANKERFAGKKVGIILSGGNVDLGKLPF